MVVVNRFNCGKNALPFKAMRVLGFHKLNLFATIMAAWRRIKEKPIMSTSAINYILRIMDLRYHDMIGKLRFDVNESYRIIEYSVNLLFYCGIFVRYNEALNHWEIVK